MKLTATLFAGALVLAGCGDDGDTGSEGDTGDSTSTETSTATGTSTETGAAGEVECPTEPSSEGGTVEVLGIGWTEDIAVNALWSELAAACGYEWNVTSGMDAGAIYTGIANGDAHVFMDAWLPATHSTYWEEHGDNINSLNVWYESAPLYWTVPSYVAEDEGITSLADLQGKADLFGGEITGIEAGAGLTRISQDEVIPTYGLGDNYELITSSTGAMLEALGSAIEDEEPILVTLWEPHSAYAKWDLTNLEDPDGALGEPDEIRTITAQGFEEEFPDLAGWLSNFSLDSEQISDLELRLEEAGEGGQAEAVASWISDNQDLVNEWFA